MKNPFLKFSQVLLLSVLVALTACDKEKEPTVTTTEASEISFEAAVIGGNVTDDGGAQILARGIAWGTSANPSLSDSFTTDESNSTGTFSHTIDGLLDGTTYYARAYATNSVGTAYGNQVTFSTTNKCLVTSLDIVAEEVGYGEETYSVNFSYDDMKKITSYAVDFEGEDEFRVDFKYGTNGLIEKAENLYGGVMEEYLKFTWDENTVTRQWYWNEGGSWYPSSWFDIITFTEDGLIEKIDSYVVYKSNPIHVGYSNYQWEGRNIILIETYYQSDWAKVKAEQRKSSIFNPKSRKSMRHLPIIDPTGKDYVKDYIAAYTYDDKINPFNFHPALGLATDVVLFVSQNNVLTETITVVSWDENYSVSYSYQYNTDGYPTEFYAAEEEYIETWSYNYDCD